MKCPKCGRAIDNHSVFCEFCGYKIKKAMWPIVLVACLLVAGGMVWYFYVKENAEKEAEIERLENEKVRAETKAEEQRFYEQCQSVADYRSYLKKYPDGIYYELAENKVKKHVDDSIAKAKYAKPIETSKTEDAVQITNNNSANHDNDFYSIASSRLLTEYDLRGCDAKTLRIMRNEIYARHGYIFNSQDLKDYFSQFSWYKPTTKDMSGKLSSVELENISFIKRHENKK